MVTDWFAGKEISTAMGIFVNPWPFGIALSLVVLPSDAMGGGVSSAFLLTFALVMHGMLAIVLFCRAAPAPQVAPSSTQMLAVIVARPIWGLYNASVGMIFSFGPSMLDERGWFAATASTATSVVLWLLSISIPLGGFLAD